MPPTRWNVSAWRSNASVRTASNGELFRPLGLFRESSVAASRHTRMHRSQKSFAASAWPNNHFLARSTRVPSQRIADRVMATTGGGATGLAAQKHLDPVERYMRLNQAGGSGSSSNRRSTSAGFPPPMLSSLKDQDRSWRCLVQSTICLKVAQMSTSKMYPPIFFLRY